MVGGKFKNALHAELSRHLWSLSDSIAEMYVSRPTRLSSVSAGLLIVLVNQLLEGNDLGGAAPVEEVRAAWRVSKSE